MVDRSGEIFRGKAAAASLKRVREHETRALEVEHLPRQSRRGLIEAGEARKGQGSKC